MATASEILNGEVLKNDYHTHTVFSHGKGTVLDNANMAKQRGLTELGIAEHGVRHRYFKRKKHTYSELKQQCIKASNETGIKVLAGIEANIIDFDGTADFNEFLNDLDFVAMGMHCQIKTKAKYFWHVFFRRKLYPNTKKQIEVNTKIFLNAIEKNKQYVDFITHPTRKFPCDIIKVATAMKNADILFELNTASCNITEEEIKQIANTGVKFIIGSDAHSPNRIGEMSNKVLPLLKHIDKNQIVMRFEPKLQKIREGKN